MALEKDLQDYLKSRKDVQEARNKLQEAKSKASQLSSALASAPQSSKASVQEQLNSAKAELILLLLILRKLNQRLRLFIELIKNLFKQVYLKAKRLKQLQTLKMLNVPEMP